MTPAVNAPAASVGFVEVAARALDLLPIEVRQHAQLLDGDDAATKDDRLLLIQRLPRPFGHYLLAQAQEFQRLVLREQGLADPAKTGPHRPVVGVVGDGRR